MSNKFATLMSTQPIKVLCGLLSRDQTIYVVGGTVRDAIVGRPTHDMDFVISGDVRPISRKLADLLGGSFFMLDDERNTARVIYDQQNGNRFVLDFATLRAGSIEVDLRARDFTINAMAFDLNNPHELIDPLKGIVDLRSKQLRACSQEAFERDPVRILRGIRLALELNLHIQPSTFRSMHTAVPLLVNVSIERQRDELFRMFDGERVHTAVRMLDKIGVLEFLLPEITALKGVSQSPPHVLDVWEHTLATIQELEASFNVLVSKYDEESAANLVLASAVLRLGRYRDKFQEHFKKRITPDRSLRSLLFLAAFLHDIGKPVTQTIDKNGQIRFLKHESVGARMATRYARDLALSQVEIKRLDTIIRNHMRIHTLTVSGRTPSRRAIYRFFRTTGDAGVDICLLSLADVLATYRMTLSQDHWVEKIGLCRSLLEAWWEKPIEVVNPIKLINGNDIQEQFKLQQGPIIGEILEVVREAQASGEVTNKDEALEYVQNWLNEKGLYL